MNNKKYICPAVIWILIFAISLLNNLSVNVHAEDKRIIKVAWYDQKCYQEMTENQKPYGYNYEYLMYIAQYTGWTYEFVRVDNFMKAYDMVKSGEVDLMGYLLKTDEREKEVEYPEVNSGTVATSLFVRTDSYIAPYDFEAFNGMKVGCMNTKNPEYLKKYAKDNNFSVQLVYYNGVKDIEAAVKNKEIDAGIVAGYQSTASTRIIANFASQPFYFCVKKGDSELISQLNYAMNAIRVDNSFYDRELSYKYIQEVKDTLHLTKEEQRYISEHKVLKVAYDDSFEPIEMTSEEGEFIGISADLLDRLSELIDVEFEYKTIGEFKKLGERPDIVASFQYDFRNGIEEGYILTNPYLNVPLASVRRSDYKEKEQNKVAVISRSADYITPKTGIVNQYIIYSTIEECINAVKEGTVDEATFNAYSVDYMLSQENDDNLQKNILYDQNYELCLAVDQKVDLILVTILNKALNLIPKSDMNAIILNNTTKIHSWNLESIIEHMPSHIIIIAVVFLLVIIFILVFMMTRQVKYSRRIKEILYTDDITDTLSFKGFEVKAKEILQSNNDKQFFIIDFDINYFEEYNTINGYNAGNELLKMLVSIFKKSFKNNELCARIQADHFVCMLYANGITEIEKFAENVLEEFRCETGGNSLLVSFGIYEVKTREVNIVTMCDCALAAKRTIKGNYDKYIAIYDEKLHKKQLESVDILSRFEDALKAGELVPYYQPKHSIRTKEIVGAEVLVRWFPKDGSIIMPYKFIELLELNGLIRKLDLYMFESVCKKLSTWMDEDKKEYTISVNVSRAHLYHAQFVELITKIAEDYNVPTSYIEIEITESAFTDNQYEMIQIIEKLHQAGFLVAIDDFGSGYSSLNLLKDIQCDVIKLDRGFLDVTSTTERGSRIIKTILGLAKELKLKTVAEGIETKEQLDMLDSYECDIAQGYYFSKPMPEAEFDKLFEQR